MLAALPWARNWGKAPTEQMYVGVSQKCRVGASPVPRTALAYGAYFISEWGWLCLLACQTGLSL